MTANNRAKFMCSLALVCGIALAACSSGSTQATTSSALGSSNRGDPSTEKPVSPVTTAPPSSESGTSALPSLDKTVEVNSVSLKVPQTWDVGAESGTGGISSDPITTIALALGDGNSVEITDWGISITLDAVRNSGAAGSVSDITLDSAPTLEIEAIQQGTGKYTQQLWISTPKDGVVSVRAIASGADGTLINAILATVHLQG